jgi:hypothetical protein
MPLQMKNHRTGNLIFVTSWYDRRQNTGTPVFKTYPVCRAIKEIKNEECCIYFERAANNLIIWSYASYN